MSPLPSPLKSPVPATDQPAIIAPTPAGVAFAPFMNKSPHLPLMSRHSKSALPSPLKSRCPTIDQPAGPVPTPAGVTCTPFISHTPVLPLPSPKAISLLPSPLKSWVSVSMLLAETPVAELHGRVVLEALLCVKNYRWQRLRRWDSRGLHKEQVVRLSREALARAGGGVRAPVVHARPDDDRRAAVEDGLGSTTVADDVELGCLPALCQIDDIVLILRRVEIAARRHDDGIRAPRIGLAVRLRLTRFAIVWTGTSAALLPFWKQSISPRQD